MAAPRLVLVGGGHAHLEVLRRAILRPVDAPPLFDLTLVAPDRYHYYSGMVPGFVAGAYRAADLRVDLPALAARAGGRFVQGEATALRTSPAAPGGTVALADGEVLPFDLSSWNIGSRAAGSDELADHPRVALVKPIARALQLRARLEELARSSPAAVAVVGGGAAGVEIACAAAAVLDRAGPSERTVTVLEAEPAILGGYSQRFRQRARRVLHAARIAVLDGARVTTVDRAGDLLHLGDGRSLAADLVIWLTGAAAPVIFRESGLPCDERGFLLVDDSLRSLGHARSFAAGDCATLAHHPATPKAGVYAVRQAPVLWQSLLASVRGEAPPRYTPQPGFLSLLDTGDGRALLRWRGLVAHARWAHRLKDRIDRSFVRRYQRLEAGGAGPT